MRPLRARLTWAAATLAAFTLGAGTLPAAEIVGRVTNGTTGQPVAGHFVNLMALRGQMVPVREAETDAQGRFRFVVDANPSERFMVQVPYRGVLYSRPALFTSGESITADVEVFELGAPPDTVQLEAHTIFLEPHRDHVRVSEFFALRNSSRPPRTFYPDGGGFRFALPGAVGDLQVSAGRAGAPPLRQQPQPADDRNTYVIDYALRPGESEVQVSYVLPLSGNALDLRLPLRTPAARRHLVVPKEGVKVEGAGLTDFPQTQAPQARVYAVEVKPPGELALRVTVDPAALEAESAAAPEPSTPAEGEGQVQIVPHPVNRAQWYIVGLSLIVLLLGLYYLTSLEAVPHGADARHSQPDARPGRGGTHA